MKQSHLFTKTRKDAPKDEVSKNAELLIRAGYIHKEMAGVYSFLPLGLRVLENIKTIVREEMDAIGGQEVAMTALQDKNLWEKTGRWDDAVIDVWFKTALKNGSEVGLGVTHEEPITSIMKDYVQSFRDLPMSAYQFQTKFRNEPRAKSGIMRGREFLMKDMYSFSRDEAEHQDFYKKATAAYVRVFERLGLGDKTYLTFAAGGMFSKFSHEFQTVSEAGEDLIYVDEKKRLAVNKEVLQDEVLASLGIKREDLVEKKAIEVGNIFSLGTRFSDALGLTYSDSEGVSKSVVMGCYGIGISRLVGSVVEVFGDENGIVWPESIAPFKVHLVALFDKNGIVKKAADELYAKLMSKGQGSGHDVEVLYDDRDLRPGEKFADSDLIGIPWRVVVSEKNLAENVLEIKHRATGKVEKVSEADFLKKFGAFASKN